jgi:hypothetical protein
MRSTRIAKFLVREAVRADPYSIKATFDAPVKEFQESTTELNVHKVYFEVGPFKYVLLIDRSPLKPLNFSVEFFLLRVDIPKDKTLQQVFSEFAGEDLSPDQAHKLYNRVVNDPYGVYNLKKLNFRVLSAVIQSVKTYFSSKDYQCILFSSEKESRTDLYRRMITKIFPGHEIIETPDLFYGSESYLFKVCKPGGVY